MVNGLKRTWKEAVESQFDVLSQYGMERGKSRKISLRLVTGIVAEIGNQDFQNMEQECHSPDRDIRRKINNKYL
jgi:hypothetical protein